MQHQWPDRELDNLLMEELASGNPSEARIRELVAQGADVCSVGSNGNSVLMEAIWLMLDLDGKGSLDEKFIYLLVQLGADINYVSEDASTALTESWWPGNPRVTEFLLKKGANPNPIDPETNETLLDYAEIDISYHKMEDPEWESHPESRTRINNLEEIIRLLRKYGARYFIELGTEAVEE
ncbi:MAG: hypothetical protein AAGU11_02135 [Syntrophobacteraceae bacterium]